MLFHSVSVGEDEYLRTRNHISQLLLSRSRTGG